MRSAEKWQEAIGYYQKYLNSNPHDAGALYDLANCYEKLGRPEEAVQTYNRYVEEVRNSDPASAERVKDRIRDLQKGTPRKSSQ